MLSGLVFKIFVKSNNTTCHTMGTQYTVEKENNCPQNNVKKSNADLYLIS